MSAESNSAVKGISVILMIISLIAGVSSIITPMRNEITSLHKEIVDVEERINKRVDELKSDIENDIKREQIYSDKEYDELKKRLEYLERNK